jgi:hypothetical protein
MEEFRYDTYCGLYCGACDIMAAFKRASERNESAKWDDIPLELRKITPAKKTDAVICFGCKTDVVFAGCLKCPIRKCGKTKMRVETCFDCARFPCTRFRIYSLIRKLFMRRLPHLKSVYANRACIQGEGIQTWLSGQKEKWKCSYCKTDFTWYAKTCPSCGKDLDFQGRYS